MTVLNLTTPQELRSGYTPTYSAFLSVIPNRQRHEAKYSDANIRSANVLGDALAQKVGIGDTERKEVISGKIVKTFKKEFYAIKYTVNMRQDMSDYQNIINKVVDINLREQDKKIFRGVDNNGILISSDPDHSTESATTINSLETAYNAINAALLKQESEVGAGPRTIGIYGDMRTYLNTFNTNEQDTYFNILRRQFNNVKFVEVPQNLIVSDKGFVLIADDFVNLHWTELAGAYKNGVNEEGEYIWTHIGFGSASVECVAPKSIIVQPMS